MVPVSVSLLTAQLYWLCFWTELWQKLGEGRGPQWHSGHCQLCGSSVSGLAEGCGALGQVRLAHTCVWAASGVALVL